MKIQCLAIKTSKQYEIPIIFVNHPLNALVCVIIYQQDTYHSDRTPWCSPISTRSKGRHRTGQRMWSSWHSLNLCPGILLFLKIASVDAQPLHDSGPISLKNVYSWSTPITNLSIDNSIKSISPSDCRATLRCAAFYSYHLHIIRLITTHILLSKWLPVGVIFHAEKPIFDAHNSLFLWHWFNYYIWLKRDYLPSATTCNSFNISIYICTI